MNSINMQLTQNSKLLIDHFTKDGANMGLPNEREVDPMFLRLFDDLKRGYTYVFQTSNPTVINQQEIENVSQIPYPEIFPSSSFPTEIRNYINETSEYYTTIKSKMFGRTITFYFISKYSNFLEEDKYQEYTRRMLVWLYIINEYAATRCSKNLKVYFYLTQLKKKLPSNNIELIGWEHANTAFTSGCRSTSEIIIYREEEWFKVFMHETFHCFGLDFADMNMDKCNKQIKKYYPINTNIELYETYTETWAEVWNVCFCSFTQMKNFNDKDEYLTRCRKLMALEQKFSVFQLIKVLGFMGLRYKNLHKKTKEDKVLRDTLYKEDTNIFAYYILKVSLIGHYGEFFKWCETNNTSILQFKKTPQNLEKFCKFVTDKDIVDSTNNIVSHYEKIMAKYLSKKPKCLHGKKMTTLTLLTDTMRMTVCEMCKYPYCF